MPYSIYSSTHRCPLQLQLNRQVGRSLIILATINQFWQKVSFLILFLPSQNALRAQTYILYEEDTSHQKHEATLHTCTCRSNNWDCSDCSVKLVVAEPIHLQRQQVTNK